MNKGGNTKLQLSSFMGAGAFFIRKNFGAQKRIRIIIRLASGKRSAMPRYTNILLDGAAGDSK